MFFRNALTQAKMDHDKVFEKIKWEDFHKDQIPKINDAPYFPNENTAMNFKRMADLKQRFESNYDNTYPNGLNWNTTDMRLTYDIDIKSGILLRRRIQNLCNGKVSDLYGYFSKIITT